MLLQTATGLDSLLDTITRAFVRDVVAAIPRVLSGLVFLTLAYVAITVALAIVRSVLGRLYPRNQRLVVDLAVAVIGLFMWFGVALALFKIVGMGGVAASLGTAVGFIGLGVAFALKEMIADTVAGVYLLRDPDFNEGDRVTTASVTGTVERIDLRKTRLRTDGGELVVLANRDVEAKWTRETGTAGDDHSSAPA